MSELKLFLLGPPRLELENTSYPLKRRKALALLVYLAVTGEIHSREMLATLFWPENTAGQARANLRRELAEINTTLGKGWFVANRVEIGVAPSAPIWLDTAHFQHLLTEWETHQQPEHEICAGCLALFETVETLYRDDFLTGITLPDAPAFDEWQFFQREGYRQSFSNALAQCVQRLSEQSQFEQALFRARRWLALDSLHEPAHRHLMQLYAWNGQQAAAIRQYHECSRLLEAELGMSPENETLALYEAIKAKQHRRERQALRATEKPAHTSAPADASTSPISPASLSNLPSQLTPFIGRTAELTEISRLVVQESNCHLLTLFGPGGIGKTRLAVQVALETQAAFAEGVHFISLAAAKGPEFIVYAMAETLNFAFFGGEDPKTQLLSYLRDKAMLLILDNFEHLVAGAEWLPELIAVAPNSKLLITSRERLNLQEEWGYEVRPLSCPKQDDPQASPLTTFDAPQLFLQAARRTRTDFTLTLEIEADIARICHLVAGVPLGLELAASWTRIMTCGEIAAEIAQSLDFLATSMRNIPERHRSLRAIFEQSWQLLSNAEQNVFSRLSVFRGGFLRDAAEQVATATLPILSALVDKSLLRFNRAGRYEIHEQLRQYAAEKLTRDPQRGQATTQTHTVYYATFLAQRTDAIKGARQQAICQEIASEIDNIRASWDQALAQGAVAEIGRSLETLYIFYETRSWFKEGKAIFGEIATALKAGLTTHEPRDGVYYQVLGQILNRQGRVYYRLAQYPEAQALLQESLRILRGLPIDQQGEMQAEIALALYSLGDVVRNLGAYDQAKSLCQESLDIYTQLDDALGKSIALNNLGIAHGALGDYEVAKQFFLASLALKQQIGNPFQIATTFNNLGHVQYLLGDLLAAQRYHQDCYEILAQLGDQRGRAFALTNLGLLAYELRDYNQAKQPLLTGIEIAEKIGEHAIAGHGHNRLGLVYEALGDYSTAQRHLQMALQVGANHQVLPLVMAVFVNFAHLLRKGQAKEKALALELLYIAADHPATEQSTKDQIEILLKELDITRTTVPITKGQRPQPPQDSRDQVRKKMITRLLRLEHTSEAMEPRHRFVQETLIATGGMGEVYQGHDTETGQRVAIKRLKPELVTQNPEIVKRLTREGEALRRLNHPNIVQILALTEDHDHPLIVMEYVSGGTLRDLLKKEPHLSLKHILDISLELADALARTHHLGILHRDIKPANILLAEDGSPRLTDFGVAHLDGQDTRLTQAGSILGTIAYLSPEACTGETLDHRSDIWSFGALLFEMIAGHPLFNRGHIMATLAAILGDPVPDLSRLRSDIPLTLITLIKQMLIKDRTRRIDSMRQIAAGLEMVRQSELLL